MLVRIVIPEESIFLILCGIIKALLLIFLGYLIKLFYCPDFFR